MLKNTGSQTSMPPAASPNSSADGAISTVWNFTPGGQGRTSCTPASKVAARTSRCVAPRSIAAKVVSNTLSRGVVRIMSASCSTVRFVSAGDCPAAGFSAPRRIDTAGGAAATAAPVASSFSTRRLDTRFRSLFMAGIDCKGDGAHRPITCLRWTCPRFMNQWNGRGGSVEGPVTLLSGMENNDGVGGYREWRLHHEQA